MSTERLRGALDELDSKKLVASYGVPVGTLAVCQGPGDVERVLQDVPFPWAMKILSKDILHKTDAGCVRLNVADRDTARTMIAEILANARVSHPKAAIRGILVETMAKNDIELIMGINRDPQFGHVILFGLGGIYVEMFKMVSMRLAPLTRYDAEQMIEELPVAGIFKGLRGKNYDKEEVIRALLALSRLVSEHPEVIEVDINPFLLAASGGRAVDAVVVAEE